MSSSSYNPYAAGSKTYNGVGSAPNTGPVTNTEGYRTRDLQYRTTKRRNNALLRRIQARRSKNYMSPDNLSAQTGRIV